ncbi:MAG: hypothetical protein KBB32_06560 [Spirochaetia bacterium]|nr:hypothetical protein [Spirochaetia bacterium]
MRRAIAMGLAALLALGAAAQEAEGIDEDALFGSEDEWLDQVDEGQDDALAALVVSEGVVLGGSVSGSLDASWTWHDPWSGFDPAAPDEYGLQPGLSSLVFFDARPEEGSRVHASVKLGWPFASQRSFLTEATIYENPLLSGEWHIATESETVGIPNITVFELFTDFAYNDALFFRFGKQTLNWGPGYFFSPANVLNIQTIDPLNPTAQLEGPLSVRAHLPVAGTQHNLWAYAVFDADTLKPEDTALAAKAEFVLGGWELSAGAWYAWERPLRGILTAAGSLDRVSVFSEAYLARGSDRTWVSDITTTLPFVETTTDDSSAFFKGTAGFMWTQSDWKLTVAGQYLYDGEGYEDSERERLIDDAYANEADIKPILDPSGADPDEAFSSFLKGLILNSGRHYAALSVAKSEFLHDDLSLSVFGVGNLSDWSGYARLSLSWRVFKGMSLDAWSGFAFGLSDSEYLVLNDGPAVEVGLGLSLGSTAF